MANQPPDGTYGRNPVEISLNISPEDQMDILRDAESFLPIGDISQKTREALIRLETTDIRSMVEIDITKIGIVPKNPPDDRFKEIPTDIRDKKLFASGRMKVPIPVCEKEGTGMRWMLLSLGFSFYRESRDSETKIIFSVFPYERSSDYLKPENERVSERQKGFEKLRRGIYRRMIPTETFNGIKEKFEPIFERWLREHVQDMIDKGEFTKLVEAVESDNTLFTDSDIHIDTEATEDSTADQLRETLSKPSPIQIPSFQCYVGEEAQAGWLNLCNRPSYALGKRETDMLKANAEDITKTVGPVSHVMVFGLGNAEKENLLISEFLKNRTGQDKPLDVHGIDVGLVFHQNALEQMHKLREESGKKVGYRGHVALFESAEEIASTIRKSTGDSSPTLRFSLGNTFCNFDDPWSVFAKGMQKGDKLLITSDIVPTSEVTDDNSRQSREHKINEIVTRYQIPEWKEWVLNPLYRMGFKGRVHPDNVEVKWDEASSAVVFNYRFEHPVGNGRDIQFSPGDEIRLYMSKKIDPQRFSRDAMRNGFKISRTLKNESDDSACFILEKV